MPAKKSRSKSKTAYRFSVRVKKPKSAKKSPRKTIKKVPRTKRKLSKKLTAWNVHMMKVYRDMKKKNPNIKLGDAMKAAKKTYKKK